MEAHQQQRYRVKERLASGGMAEVFLAESAGIEGFKKQVAIKRVLPALSEKKRFIAMFLDEARLSANLSHSNVAQVFDIGVGDSAYFIVMEYVDGADLKQLVEYSKRTGQGFSVEAACFIASKICEGLTYAHELKGTDGTPLEIIHRDMSPPNVLITKHGEVKIVDFGLAKAQSQLEKSEAGIIKGKFGYLSPEKPRRACRSTTAPTSSRSASSSGRCSPAAASSTARRTSPTGASWCRRRRSPRSAPRTPRCPPSSSRSSPAPSPAIPPRATAAPATSAAISPPSSSASAAAPVTSYDRGRGGARRRRPAGEVPARQGVDHRQADRGGPARVHLPPGREGSRRQRPPRALRRPAAQARRSRTSATGPTISRPCRARPSRRRRTRRATSPPSKRPTRA